MLSPTLHIHILLSSSFVVLSYTLWPPLFSLHSITNPALTIVLNQNQIDLAIHEVVTASFHRTVLSNSSLSAPPTILNFITAINLRTELSTTFQWANTIITPITLTDSILHWFDVPLLAEGTSLSLYLILWPNEAYLSLIFTHRHTILVVSDMQFTTLIWFPRSGNISMAGKVIVDLWAAKPQSSIEMFWTEISTFNRFPVLRCISFCHGMRVWENWNISNIAVLQGTQGRKTSPEGLLPMT